MYKLIYTVPFTNVDGQDYTIQILEDGGTASPVELTGGTPPFIVEVNNEDFLYTPTRFSGATLKLVGSDYLQKLFSTDYQKFKVNLVTNGSVVWTGFISPELYSQDYDNSLFELEIECISALATLEYIAFEHDSEKITFKDLIKKCITASKGDFKAVYVPNTYTESLASITISSANFIDEEGKPMTLLECLEELCKFLNWTVTEYSGNVYFLDIDYLQKGNKAFTDLLSGTQVNIQSNIDIASIASKGNENTLSILGGYNEATVIDSDYELDSEDLYPEISLDEKIDSADIIAGADGKKVDKNESTYKLRWYLSKYFQTHNYQYTNGWSESKILLKDYAGSYVVNFTSYKNEDKPVSLDWQKMFEIKMKYAGNLLDGSTEPEDLDSHLPHPDVYNILQGNIDSYLKPMITNLPSKKGAITFPDDAYLGINLSVNLVPTLDPNFRGIPIELNHKKDKIDDMLRGNFVVQKLKESDLPKIYCVPAEIKVGNKYYNGTSWTTAKSICRIPLDVNKDTHVEGKWIGVKNNNSFEKGVEDLGECYLIPVDSGLYGKLEITFFIPVMPARTKEYIYIKDVKVESARVNLSDNKKEKKDTKYTNVVNDDYINALEDIEFKITSKNDSNLCFSKAIINNGWLDVLHNNIYNTAEKPEKLLINRIINQYKQPKLKLIQKVKPEVEPYSIITDSHITGKKFLFTGGSIDFEDNSIDCNMIELN